MELLLYSLLGVVSQVTVQQLVGVDLHQVQHGESAGVLVDLQGSDVTFLDTANYILQLSLQCQCPAREGYLGWCL